MPATHVLVEHDGRWVVAQLLRQYRHQGRWRALVRYTTEPGITFEHARWCGELRPLVLDGEPEAERHQHRAGDPVQGPAHPPAAQGRGDALDEK
jgi:hypothetical protein